MVIPDSRRGPICSIVIPAYNASHTVSSAVRSVLGQTVSDLEVIVVDDGSVDDTADLVQALDDPRVRLFSQPNRGLAAARNAGIRAARGRHVAFLDSDDLLLPRFVELTVEALEHRPSAGLAYTDAYVFESATGRVRQRSAMARSRPPSPPPSAPEEFLAALLRRNFVYVSTTVPRAVLDEVGLFDEARTSCEDYELWLRILLAGYRAVWVPGRQALYRKHARQMSRNQRRMASNLSAVYDALPDAPLNDERLRRLLVRRRRSARLNRMFVAPVFALVPMGAVTRLKGRGVTESWYAHPPADVAAAFPDLSVL